MSNTLEQRVEQLEKKVAELEKEVRPEHTEKEHLISSKIAFIEACKAMKAEA